MTRNRSMPPAVIIPELPYPDLRQATDWLCRTFGFTERLRIGNHRAQLSFGEGSLVVTQGNNSSDASFSIMVRVEAIDSHYERVKQSGARIVSAPADYPYGERQYTVEDPGGHRWTFSQTIADVDPRTWGGILFED
ncbi:MAG TPA: VOC family protein [Anaerolineales bacterium]|nr:VOC family protein [Anaerolineales bacterium]